MTGVIAFFNTRCKYIHAGSIAASMRQTVLKKAMTPLDNEAQCKEC